MTRNAEAAQRLERNAAMPSLAGGTFNVWRNNATLLGNTSDQFAFEPKQIRPVHTWGVSSP